MTFRSKTGWTWNGDSWEPPRPSRAKVLPASPGRVVTRTRMVKLQPPRPEPASFEPPGGMATLSGFDSLISFGTVEPPPGLREIPRPPVAEHAPDTPALSVQLSSSKPASVELVAETDDDPEPVTLVGLGFNPALGRSASVFDHLSYEGRDWSAEEIERVGQKSEKRSWERRRHEEPIWPWLLSGALFIAGVTLMLGNLTGLFFSYQPLGMMVSAMGLFILHTKARNPIRIKHVSAMVAIMLAVTLFSGTRSYASNQTPAPAVHESPR